MKCDEAWRHSPAIGEAGALQLDCGGRGVGREHDAGNEVVGQFGGDAVEAEMIRV
jgi:hypothetical protein